MRIVPVVIRSPSGATEDRKNSEIETKPPEPACTQPDMAELVRNRLTGLRRRWADRAWPDSLKTTVRILLTSRFSMWMAWGPELTFLYNDAYARTTLGKKHPWALGRPAAEVWSEIWKDIGPRIDRVMENGRGLVG